MKKLTYSLSILLATASFNSYAFYGSARNACVPNYNGGFFIGVTGLYWRTSDLDLANIGILPLVSTPITSAVTPAVSRFDDHDRDSDYDWGYQINVGYVFPCSGNDIQLTFTHYDQDHSFRPVVPLEVSVPVGPVILEAITPVTGTVTSVVPALPAELFPATDITTTLDVSEASASSEIRYNAVDLDLGQHINVGCNFKLRWFGGLRYANFERTQDKSFSGSGAFTTDPVGTDFTVTIITDAPPGTTGTVHFDTTGTGVFSLNDVIREKSDFNGIGPRFGVESAYNFFGGFGIVGAISSALIVGEADSSISERLDEEVTTTFTSVPTITPAALAAAIAGFVITGDETTTSSTSTEVHVKRPDRTRVVPNIDAKLGLDYVFQFSNCSQTKLILEAGYMVSHYWNTDSYSPRPEFLNRDSKQITDTSFDGPYVTLKVQI